MSLRSGDDKKHRWKENIYTEEDFADWLAAKTTDKNMACLFVQGIALTTVEKIEDLFINENKKDPHSSGFYRMINVELQQKGKLPVSCQNDFVKLCPDSQDK